MSHNKRKTCNSASGSGGSFPALKKAKSQTSPPFSTEKNGMQRRAAGNTADDNDDDDTDSMRNPVGVAANLSRKKATPPQPQPAKKFVIKLTKGSLSISSIAFFSFLG